jgi:hypothetical protein
VRLCKSMARVCGLKCAIRLLYPIRHPHWKQHPLCRKE